MQNDFLDELDKELSWSEILPKVENVKKSFTTKKAKNQNQNENSNQDLESSDKTEENFENISLRQTLNFPEVKFYLPTLRQGYTRFIPVWWNNETWAKNMNMFQYEEEILLVDCGIQFAEPDMLWANCSIPDISFLIPYKKNIKGLIITHAHLDHIWALKHILPALDFPTLYGTKLTIWIINNDLRKINYFLIQTLLK